MNIEDIRVENDIYVYLGTKLEAVCEVLNMIFDTKNVRLYGTEWDIPKYGGGRRIYGGGRVDMMFGNNKMNIPMELKYDGNENGYWQLRRYVDMVKEGYNGETNGVLLCKHATKGLKQMKIDNDIVVIQLEPWKVW